jgi:predicted nucleic acid-binding protein
VDKYVLDASVLIDLKRSKQLRRLSKPIASRRIVVPLYVRKKIEQSSAWRGWIKRYGKAITATFQTTAEHRLFAKLIVIHGSEASNPRLADDDIQAVTIACCRGIPLAMRDRHAEDLARQLRVRVLHAQELLDELAGRPAQRLFD